jgi:host factor-I protein
MAVELETGLPSTRKLQGYIRDKQQVEVNLLTNEAIAGVLLWQDPHCLCVDSAGTQVLLWWRAVAYVKPLA